MKTQTDKTQELQNLSTPRVASESSNGGTVQLMDNRTSTIDQRKLKSGIDSSENTKAPIQRKNNTGLPDTLKSGIENLSGYSMDDVKVHYNSSKPAQLQAHAYAQGTNIHLAPGQEKHLPHEAWHVVQQKEGRVKPTRQLKSKVNINDAAGLEKEADVMGAKALKHKKFIKRDMYNTTEKHQSSNRAMNGHVVQKVQITVGITLFRNNTGTNITYDDTQNIGGGAAGQIYTAILNNQNVVVKTGDDISEEIEIFRRLYAAGQRNTFSNIIKPIGYFLDNVNDDSILVLERAQGSLIDLPTNMRSRIHLIKDTWQGLLRLHANGIQYNDLSQKNTLFHQGKAKLADFGESFDYAANNQPLDHYHDYDDFIKISCNILLGKDRNNRPDTILNLQDRQTLRQTLTELGLNVTTVNTLDGIVGRIGQYGQNNGITDRECANFVDTIFETIEN
ncbi:protein kinase domain-containing protein [Aquimarina macrocephali]|uniref:protein kinase domain-containing protein n=1 Tax=Aquimarina macrocephali TaxID=666563 RepID=UPI0004B5A008|nr:DUF4157 domain-containing protein [Aquimarina macrocephali]